MSPTRWLRRSAIAIATALALSAFAAALHPRVRYVAIAGSYQLELLWGRVPLERALAQNDYTDAQRHRLGQAADIRAFAREIGLKERGHYSMINPSWDRTVHNVSACAPLAFEPATWWFPIVGTVPYLGYFDLDAARAEASRLASRGLDVHVRPAGAWSTLGWFRDPLLPEMADWDEARFANTLLHELTHATVWIPGSVAFNESLASFVGDEASARWLARVHGPDTEAVRAERARRADRARFQRMMHDVYQDLDALYASDEPEAVKLQKKRDILDALPERAMSAGFAEPERWRAWMSKEPWNNARLVQFRVYNRSPERFAILLAQQEGDLGGFLEQVVRVTRGARDPYRALAAAVGEPYEGAR
jgi:predicted aminopeptidase